MQYLPEYVVVKADLQLVIDVHVSWPLFATSVAMCDVIVVWNVVSGEGSVWSDCKYLQLCKHMYV